MVKNHMEIKGFWGGGIISEVIRLNINSIFHKIFILPVLVSFTPALSDVAKENKMKRHVAVSHSSQLPFNKLR